MPGVRGAFLLAGVPALLALLVATLFFRSRYGAGHWMAGLPAGYAAALLFEHLDDQVKAVTGTVGGHLSSTSRRLEERRALS